MVTSSSPGPSLVLPHTPPDASSLRAVALKTLKLGKRRRPASGQPQIVPPARPIPQDTFQLDYGQDDSQAEAELPAEVTTTPTISPPHSPTSVAANPPAQDVDMREEGEISDEDTSPVEETSLKPCLEQNSGATGQADYLSMSPASPHSGSPVPALLTRPSIPSRIPSIPESPASSIPYVERTQHSALSGSSHGRPTTPVPHFPFVSSRERSPYYHDDRSSSPDTRFSPARDSAPLVDADHVRPGLTMTQEEYNSAKDLILDLLGWGVFPEYLVDCGLSRLLVYYIFTELKLALPTNLNMTGLIPYQLKDHSSLAIPDESRGQLPPHIGSHIREQTPVSPSLSEQVDRPASSVKAPTSPLVSAPASSDLHDLHDMERQRREELLARKKVVQDSRKTRRGSPGAGSMAVQSLSLSDPDTEEALAPTETVENFLRTIDPSNQVDDSSGQLHAKPAMDRMDVDEIPGLRPQANFPTISSPTSYATPTFSGDSVATSFSRGPDQSTNGVSTHPAARKRGPRRPVASDFVDVDDSHSPAPNSGTRPNLQSGVSFASISKTRRFIIDLSDSEDDDDQLENGNEHIKRPQFIGPTWAFNNFNMSGVSSRSSPAPLASIKTRSNTVTPSPDALALELKIRRMREEIAQREENQKRKALAKLSTPSATDVTTQVATPSFIDTPQESREQSAIPQLHAQLELTSQSNDIPDREPSQPYTDQPYADASGIPDNGNSITSYVPNYCRTSDIASHYQTEGLQETIEPTSKHNYPLDSEQNLPSLIINAADSNLPLSAQVPQDIDHTPELQSPVTFAPSSPEQFFQHYKSTLSNYPLLRVQMTPSQHHAYGPFFSDICSATQPNTAVPARTMTHDLYSYSQDLVLPDLQKLKLATLMKPLDPSKQLCQYEVPGRGVCRDEECDDVHLSRLSKSADGEAMEPSDQETATFLLGVTPAEWQSGNNITEGKMIAALTMVRQSASLKALSFEERAARALAVLERPSVPKT